MHPPSTLRGDAPAFCPALRGGAVVSFSSVLRGDAPVFYPKQQLHHYRYPTPAVAQTFVPYVSENYGGPIATAAFIPYVSQHQSIRRPRRRLPKLRLQPQCTFISLPAELRNKIYELAVLSTEPIVAIKPATDYPQAKRTFKSAVPALAQTCHQIRRECLGMYYAGNVFIFDTDADEYMDDSIANGWVKSLARSRMECHVKRVGCKWRSLHIEGDRVVSVEMSIIATLGEDDTVEEKQDEARLTALLEEGEILETKPKVVFELRAPFPVYSICEHVLWRCAEAFEKRREGKSIRGYGALIDVVLTTANFLRPLEVCIYLKECHECEASGRK